MADTDMTEDSVVAHLAPEQWMTVDYSKVV